VSVSSDGSFTYDPTVSETLNALSIGDQVQDTFSYEIDDDNGGTDSATVTITVTGVNDDPTADDTTEDTNEDTVLEDTVAADASDPDTNDELTFSGDEASELGAEVSVSSNGTFTYDPTVSETLNALAGDEELEDTFTYNVDDGNGGTDSATVTITVAGVNDDPVANAANNDTDEDTVLEDTLTGDVDDPDTSDVLTFTGDATSELGASVSLSSDGSYTYDPTGVSAFNALAVGEELQDTFGYGVSDGNSDTEYDAVVTITVIGVNDDPTADDVTGETHENTVLEDTLAGEASDPDTSDELTFSGDETSELGATVSVSSDGSFSYNPTQSETLNALSVGEEVEDTFSYYVDDGNGGDDEATVTITVTGTNDPPTAYEAIDITDEDTALEGDLTDDAFDPDTNDDLIFSGDTTSELGADVSVSIDGSFSYDPAVSETLNAMSTGDQLQDTFTYSIDDDNGGTDSATVTITVTGVNDHPNADDTTDATDEDTSLEGNVAGEASDPDTNDELIFNGDSESELGASVSVSSDGSFTYDPTGSETLNALSVGEQVEDSFVYYADDQNGGDDSATVTITVTGTNDDPTADDVDNATDEHTVLEDSLAGDASDPDTNDELTFSGDETSGLGAAVSVSSDGSFSYDPTGSETLDAMAVGEQLEDTFTYDIDDDNGGTDSATVTITVTGVNDAPTANDVDNATDEDTALQDTLVFEAYDPDTREGLTFSGDSESELGASVSVSSDGSFTYDPTGSETLNALSTGEQVEDSFVFYAVDEHGGDDSATVTITVTGVNDAPTADDVDNATDEDTVLDDTLAGEASDPDTSDELTFSGDTTSELGAAVSVSSDGTFSYDPGAIFNALAVGEQVEDTFGYSIDDDNGGTDSATVTITITGVNDDPTADDVDNTTDEDTVWEETLAGDATDPDTTDELTFSGDETSELGADVSVSSDGSVTYDPTVSDTLNALSVGEQVEDSFVYYADDGNGGEDTATVTITVTGINDAPTADDVDNATDEDTVLDDTLAGDASDPDTSDDLTFSGDTTSELGAAVSVSSDGTFSYDPGSVFNALAVGEQVEDTFSYGIDDDNGGTDSATVTITVTGVNDAPTADDATGTTTEDAVLNDTVGGDADDPDTSDDLAFSGDTTSDKGAAVSVSSDGSFSYDPTGSATLQALAVGEHTDDTFDYTADDGNGGTDSATVTVTVNGVNDAPKAEDATGTTTEDAVLNDTLAGDADDPDTSDDLTFSGDTTSDKGAAVSVSSDGSFSYDPTGSTTLQALAVGEQMDDTFSYGVDDDNGGTDTATVTITVNGVNDAPEASNATESIDEDSVLNDSLAGDAGDPDTTDTLTFSGSTTSEEGVPVSVSSNGSFSYDPTGSATMQALAVGEHIDDAFSYSVDDDNGGTDSGAVTITVQGVNDAPTAGDADVSTDEDTVINDTLAGEASDPDTSDDLTFSGGTTSEEGAAVSISSDGTFTYDPNASVSLQALNASDPPANDAFTYSVSDGNGGTDSGTVTITVTGLDEPVSEPLSDAANNTYAATSIYVANPPNFALAQPLSLDSSATVTGFGVHWAFGYCTICGFAIYEDNSGQPGTQVGTMDGTCPANAGGTATISGTPFNLDAGQYWVGANFAACSYGSTYFISSAATNATTHFKSQTAPTMPEYIPSSTTIKEMSIFPIGY
jgi:VCBS repeat-containing protein